MNKTAVAGAVIALLGMKLPDVKLPEVAWVHQHTCAPDRDQARCFGKEKTPHEEFETSGRMFALQQTDSIGLTGNVTVSLTGVQANGSAGDLSPGISVGL
jgi:hypothetical protein